MATDWNGFGKWSRIAETSDGHYSFGIRLGVAAEGRNMRVYYALRFSALTSYRYTANVADGFKLTIGGQTAINTTKVIQFPSGGKTSIYISGTDDSYGGSVLLGTDAAGNVSFGVTASYTKKTDSSYAPSNFSGSYSLSAGGADKETYSLILRISNMDANGNYGASWVWVNTTIAYGNSFSYSAYNPDTTYNSFTASGTAYSNVDNTYYASRKTYTLSYDANGGSGAPSSTNQYYQHVFNLSSTKPTRTGYDFLGWSGDSSATVATYSAGASYTMGTSTTLYAIWKRSVGVIDSCNAGTYYCDSYASSNVSLALSLYSSAYYHRLSIQIGSGDEKILKTVSYGTTSTTFLVSSAADNYYNTDLAKYIKDTTSGIATVYLRTYSDSSYSTLIGSSSATFIVLIKDDTEHNPSFTGSVELTETSSLVKTLSLVSGTFLQNNSILQIKSPSTVVTTTTADIVSWKLDIIDLSTSITIATNTVSSSSTSYTWTINPISSSGSLGIKITVTDKRDRSTTYSYSSHDECKFNVIPYTAPSLNAITPVRVDENGVLAEEGDYFGAYITYAVSPINSATTSSSEAKNLNTAILTLTFDGGDNETINLLSHFNNSYTVVNSLLSTVRGISQSSIKITANLKDVFNTTTTFSFELEDVYTLMHYYKNGYAMGIGKMVSVSDIITASNSDNDLAKEGKFVKFGIPILADDDSIFNTSDIAIKSNISCCGLDNYAFSKWTSGQTFDSSTTSRTYTLSTIKTRGRPVFISFNFDWNPDSDGSNWISITLYRESTQLSYNEVVSNVDSWNAHCNVSYLDIVSSGEYNYSVVVTLGNGSGTLTESSRNTINFLAYEI